MLARVVEVSIKGGKKQEAAKILQNELLPVLRKQPGFVAYETLARDVDPNVTTSITYWQSKDDAESCYSMPAYNTILNKLRPLLSNEIRPVLHTVEISTTQRIAIGKAA
jgi:quinol monooxygenase YgiN